MAFFPFLSRMAWLLQRETGSQCEAESLLEMLLAPRRSLGLALLLYSFVEDTLWDRSAKSINWGK